jgi:hypothetical protein
MSISIAPILITANNKQLTLKITGQSLNLEALESNTSKVDIIATISSAQSADELLNLPISFFKGLPIRIKLQLQRF